VPFSGNICAILFGRECVNIWKRAFQQAAQRLLDTCKGFVVDFKKKGWFEFKKKIKTVSPVSRSSSL
jgi:hypothetical protein